MKFVITGEHEVRGTAVYINDTLLCGVKSVNLKMDADKSLQKGFVEVVVHENALTDEQKSWISGAEDGWAACNIAELPVKISFEVQDTK